MSDLIEIDEPTEGAHEMRDEIRRVSDRVRARRITISRIMVGLCGVALAIAAVPLVLLIIQLISKGAPTLSWKFFTTLPTTPSLIDPNATGGVSNEIVGTITLTIYASIMAIPLGVFSGVYLAESSSKLASTLRV